MNAVDRIQYAAELSRNKRVLDIGGKKMPNCDPNSPFARGYAGIDRAAAEYRIVDYQDAPDVDFLLDLNTPEGIAGLRNAVDEYQPEVILCMETLEHLNLHFECMNQLAHAVSAYGAEVFITVPNNGNWIFNALGWNHDHCVAFFKDIAMRFVSRSDLGRHEVTEIPCMQKYLWYWPLVYAGSFFQPMNLGFHVRPRTKPPTD